MKTRDEAEPKRIGEHLGRWAGRNTCMTCGTPMAWPPATPERDRVPICTVCDSRAKTDRITEDRTKAQRCQQRHQDGWRTLAGGMCDSDSASLPLEAARRACEAWKPTLRHGVTILGTAPSGSTGRTRTIWCLLRKAWDAELSIEARPAAEFRAESNSLARHGDQAAGIRALIQKRIVAIDDFGLHSFTPASCEFFTTLIDRRTRAGRPTILGSPMGPQGLAKAFDSREFAGAFIRRITTQHAWVIDATTDRLTTPTR